VRRDPPPAQVVADGPPTGGVDGVDERAADSAEGADVLVAHPRDQDTTGPADEGST
jgi:hypothetical protein